VTKEVHAIQVAETCRKSFRLFKVLMVEFLFENHRLDSVRHPVSTDIQCDLTEVESVSVIR
jgi:hypothetical protein